MKRFAWKAALLLVLLPSAPVAAQCVNYADYFHWRAGFNFSGGQSEILLAGNYAFVANNFNGLRVIDITDPDQPFIAGSFDTPGQSVALALAGDRLFIADTSGGLRIIDVSDPTQPIEVGHLDASAAIRDIVIQGSTLYAAADLAGLVVVDISVPGAESIVTEIPTGIFSECVAVQGTHVYLCDIQHSQISHLLIFDISDPKAPSITGTVDLSTNAIWVTDVVVDAGYAYVTQDHVGMLVVDVSNPASPTLVETMSLDNPGKVTISGDLLYVGTSSLLNIIDIANPESPAILRTRTMPGPEHVVLEGDLAFVVGGGFNVYANPAAIPVQLINSIGVPGLEVTVSGSYAYVAGFGMKIVDIQNPNIPSIMSSTGSFNCSEIAIKGSFAYVPSLSSTRIYDVSDPSLPVLQGTIVPVASARWITIEGDLGYIADAIAGIEIVDVSNPPSSPLLGFVDTPGVAIQIIVSGDFAYVADGTEGLQVVDISSPAAPQIIGSSDQPVNAEEIALLGTTVFIADGTPQIQAFDVSNPMTPTWIATHDFPSTVDALFTSPPFLYVDGNPDLMVFDATDPANLELVGGIQGLTNDITIAGGLLFTMTNQLKLNIAPAHCGAATSVGETVAAAGTLSISPNPMTRSGSDIRFTAARNANLQLTIYDLAGRRVRVLTQGVHEGGSRAFHWAGHDDLGQSVAPGVYFARLAIDDATREVQKVVLLR